MMRDRPFIAASESPRPFSEVKAERGDFDVTETTLRAIAELETDALEASDPKEAMRLQCAAEDLRCALDEFKPRRP